MPKAKIPPCSQYQPPEHQEYTKYNKQFCKIKTQKNKSKSKSKNISIKAKLYDEVPSEIKAEIMEFDPIIIKRLIDSGESKTALKFLKKMNTKLSKHDIIELQEAAIMKNDRLITPYLLNMHQKPMLKRAIISGHPLMVLTVLKNDPKNGEIQRLHDDQSSYLHFASVSKNSRVLRVLLRWMKESKIIDKFIDVQDKSGNTALHLAAKSSESSSVKALLEYGANKRIENNKYQLAKNLASDLQIVALLK